MSFETWRVMLPLMVASPALMRSSERSFRRTSRPAREQTWAMPLPIWPAPITPTVLISIAIRLLPRTRLSLWRCWPGALASDFRQFLLEFRQNGEKVADEAVIRNLENRRFLVLVDGDDDLRILHAGEMLDRARDADGDVEVRRHHLAGLPDLPVVRRVAGIDGGPGRPHGGPELVGDRLDVFGEIFGRAERATARDDDPGRCELRTVA